MRTGAAVMLSLGLTCASLIGIPANATSNELVANVLASVVHLRVYDEHGHELSQGSGFFLEDGRVVTNAHVLSGGSWVEVYDTRSEYLGSATYSTSLNVAYDLAILPAPEYLGPGLPMARRQARAGDEIWAFGSPLGLQGSVSAGIVAAQREYSGVKYLQITAPISSGSSGGPVVNAQGEVVGVVVSILPEGQNINFAVSVQNLGELVNGPDGKHSFPAKSEEQVDGTDQMLAWQAMATLAAFALADSIGVGERIDGQLTEDDLQWEGPVDIYRFAGLEGQAIRASVISSEFDAFTGVMEAAGLWEDNAWSAHDDDSGEGTDASLTAILPVAGSYYLIVRSLDGKLGAYRASLINTESGYGVQDPHQGGDRWIYVATTESGDEVYYDSRSITNHHGQRRVWVKMLFSEVEGEHGTEYNKALYLMRLDCRARKLACEAEARYFGSELVESQDMLSHEQNWSHVLHGSIGEAVLDEVCSQ